MSLEKERNDLLEKMREIEQITNMADVAESSEINPEEKELMIRQHAGMMRYLEFLERRIERQS